jgi:hypothetical protein
VKMLLIYKIRDSLKTNSIQLMNLIINQRMIIMLKTLLLSILFFCTLPVLALKFERQVQPDGSVIFSNVPASCVSNGLLVCPQEGISRIDSSSETPSAKSDSEQVKKIPKAIPITAERKKELSKYFSGWNGSHIKLTKLLKEKLDDPESFDHAETTYWDYGDRIRVVMEYRTKNKFGALVKSEALGWFNNEGTVIHWMSAVGGF